MKPFSSLFNGLLLALLALASVAASARASSDVTAPGPSVDPELNWLTPQEFKVELLSLSRQRNFRCCCCCCCCPCLSLSFFFKRTASELMGTSR